MGNKNKYLGKNILLFSISSFGTKFLSFFLVPLYTNVLSTREYGTADIVSTTALLLTNIFTLNIADSVLRFGLEDNQDKKEVFSIGNGVVSAGSLCLGLCLYIVSFVVSWKEYCCFIWLYFFANSYYQMLSNYLRVIDKIKQVAISAILLTLSTISLNLLFLLVFRMGLRGYLISICLAPIVSSFYCLSQTGLSVSDFLSLKFKGELAKEMLLYSIPLVFNGLSLWINSYLDRYFITFLIDSSSNGLYSVANKIPTILGTCYSVFTLAWNLSAVKEFDPNDDDGFFSNTYKVYNSLIVCVCSFLILINILLARVLFAKDFFHAWNYSSVLLISVLFNALTAFYGSIFAAVKRTEIIAMTTVAAALCNIVLNVILIPLLGVMGASVATAISYFSMWAIRTAVLKKYINLKINYFADIIVYIILVIQVFFEHTSNHSYIGQIGCFLLIICVYRKYLIEFVKKLVSSVWPKSSSFRRSE